ncbi:GxGYxYP domain-containing protein [Sedimentisphaera salicampi]|uniref:Uncharacterized protein n=1 Tax=Sedimentisphaera salicampi TaxID=1941349 RepID=A0A1W6LJ33_9BACT|nr:GxGYxYP domain-containing protein [Sedimentisphaera salicampi]ARN55791.1 hypothetical protein STSP1_00156 [Sedimentisphaera salicampi]
MNFSRDNQVIAVLFVCVFSFSANAIANSPRWFPSQEPPEFVLKTNYMGDLGSELPDKMENKKHFGNLMHILAQSVSGLAAKGVNQGKTDEMIWIQKRSSDYQKWFKMTKERLGFEDKGVHSLTSLIKRFKKQGLIEGYIVYSYDDSKGGAYTEREDIDSSLNVATTLAGIRNAILLEENVEVIGRRLGLKRLFDARGKTMDWCYDNVLGELNRNALLTVDPKVGYNRAVAIANRCACVYGINDITAKFSEWLNPPSPVFGWNCGGEAEQTGLVTEYGHFQTATNWALNLPLLSADSENAELRRIKAVEPSDINYNDNRRPAAFIMSDGDNLQWITGKFCMDRRYWANPYHGGFPMGWTICPGHLSQLCPAAFNYLSDTQPKNSGLMEYGGGYYYPDLFAKKRENRLKYLEMHAERISHYLNRTGIKVFSFICKDVDSPEALEAYSLYAKKLKGIYGMIAVQYYPYNGGDGEIFWYKNSEGTEIPVITATHSIWNNARWEGGGTPAKIARLINEDSTDTGFSIVSSHAWSKFNKIPDNDQEAENVPKEASKKQLKNAESGLTPVKWCVDRLNHKDVHVVTPEELIWRVRMEKRPEQTEEVINRLQKKYSER